MFRVFDSIDPVAMTADENRYLGRLLLQIHAESGEVYFPAGISTHQIARYGADPVRLNLRRPILIRARENNPDQLRFEVIGDEIGAGGFSHVYKIIQTLIPQADGSLTSKNKRRVVKVQVEPPKASKAIENVTAKKEYRQASQIQHLHVKHPVYSNRAKQKISYMIGGYMFGCSLERFLTQDSKSGHFSLEDRLRLSVELIRALREQVHAQNIVHRDVKSGNVIVNAKSGKSPQAFYIDFGLSKHVSAKENLKCGTYKYLAPEIWKAANATQAADVYSLGVMLGELWGVPLPDAANTTYESSLNRDFHMMFANIHGLSSLQKDKLKQTIKQMCAPSPDDRITLDVAEAAFNEVRFEQCLSLEDQKSRDVLVEVQSLARKLRHEMQKYCLLNKDQWNINVVRREIGKAMMQFPDKSLFVKEFVAELHIRALDDLTDKESIRKKMQSLTADFIFAREDAKVAFEALSSMVSAGLDDFDAEYQAYLKHTLTNATRRRALLPKSVDDVVTLTAKLQHNNEKIKKEIDYMHHVRIQSGHAPSPLRPLTSSHLPSRYLGFFPPAPVRKEPAPVQAAWDMPLISVFSRL